MGEPLKLTAVATGFGRLFDVQIENLKDLWPVFRRFDQWLRPEIQKVFDQQGPGWQPLSDATKKNRDEAMPSLAATIRERALNGLERSVGSTAGKAEKRLAGTDAYSHLLARRQRTVAKQAAQLAEAKRIASDQRSAAYSGVQNGRQFAKLGQRVEKYRERAEQRIAALERGELLGRVASSIRSTIKKGSLLIESAIPWSSVHNDGGTANNHAHIPKRTFLEWTPLRIERFIEMVQEYVTDKESRQS